MAFSQKTLEFNIQGENIEFNAVQVDVFGTVVSERENEPLRMCCRTIPLGLTALRPMWSHLL